MKTLGEVNAKVVLSKPMIRDLATQQAIREGQTDLKVIAEQAKVPATWPASWPR